MTSCALHPRKHEHPSRQRGSLPGATAEGPWQLPLPPPFLAPLPLEQPALLFTIGHGALPADALVALLHTHDIDTVVDVRSSPYSRYVPHCNRESLETLLHANAIAYIWAGDTLGGRPGDATCYHGGEVRIGKVDYAQVAQRPWFQAGLRIVLGAVARHRAALLCSEEDPRRCHRHALIAHALHALGVRVLHIRRTGELEEADTLESAALAAGPQQLALGGFAA